MLTMSFERQLAFAALSGDHNPMHVDLEEARRSQFGGCVVHGVHLVFAALGASDRAVRLSIASIDAQFRSAVMVGDEVSFHPVQLDHATTRIAVHVGDKARAIVTVIWRDEDQTSVPAAAHWSTDCKRLMLAELRGVSGTEPLAIDVAAFEDLFPGLASRLDLWDAAMLLATTRVVGMRCPGQWALFRQLTWRRESEGSVDTQVDFEVLRIDERFSMVEVGMTCGPVRVLAEVLVRDAPPAQLAMAELRDEVSADAFVGMRALVVGGSRGLGELVAKLFVAGGGQVLLSYRDGLADAERLVAELGECAGLVHADTDRLSGSFVDAVAEFRPNHVSFMASPPIIRQSAGSFDPAVYQKLTEVYAFGLSSVLAIAQRTGDLRTVFVPSSIYVDDTPVGFEEYRSAKLAAEAVCDAWQRAHPDQRVIVERLPPLVTDQTSALLGNDASKNVAVILPVLQRLTT